MPAPHAHARPLLALLGLAVCTSAQAGERVVYEDAVRRIDTHYLYIDDLDASEALAEAAEAAEAALPWLLADRDGDGVRLVHGELGPIGRVQPVQGGLTGLPAALEALEDQLVAAAALTHEDGEHYGVPDGVDLPVELLRGVSRALDRHSIILSGDRLERFDERITGKLQGIGARISRQDEQLVVEQVFPSGPADVGGVLPGDRVVRVDGASTVGMSVSTTVDRIRGAEGTQVQLELAREVDGQQETVVLVLTRAEVRIPNVMWEVEPQGTGYIEITHFSEQTARLLRQALADFQVAGVRGIVIDLRDNSGGSMIQSCQAADLFLDTGPVLRTAGRDDQPVDRLIQHYRSESSEDEPQVPIVVLVGPGSASASEILAGALVLRDRAVLVGARTHGKGTVQKLYTLRRDEGEARARFKLTVARYLLPDDIPIETAVGLPADLEVDSVRFDQWQVDLPEADEASGAYLKWVEELPGWRDPGLAEARGDHARTVARQVALSAESAHRADLLAAIDGLSERESGPEDDALVETFRYRGIDWRAGDEAGAAPQVAVRVELVDDPVAGDLVEIRALVENLGEAPLYRTWAALSADDHRLPWHGMSLPVGYLPPGETGMGRAVVRIDDDEPERRDRVDVTVHADQREPSETAASVLDIHARPAPPVRTTARIVQGESPEDLVLEATFENRGVRTLESLRMKVGLHKSGPLELVQRSVTGASLAPGERQTLRFPLRSPEGRIVGEVPLQIRLEAARWGRVVTVPFDLEVGGEQAVRQPAEIDGRIPVEHSVGPTSFTVTVRDDMGIEDITAWYDGEKVAWSSPGGAEAELTIPVDVGLESRMLVVKVTDSDGVRQRRNWWIRGLEPADDGVVEGITEP